MSLLKKLSDNHSEDSLANKLRRKRFEFFQTLYTQVQKKEGQIKILDLGGTVSFWAHMGFLDIPNLSLTIVNLSFDPEQIQQSRSSQNRTSIECVIGDACNLHQFNEDQFDIVFSNSVIEHVGSLEKQQRMVCESQRVGKRYFIQTPNYFFPIEPHFHIFGFQFLPFQLRVKLVQHFNLGWFTKQPDRERAKELVRSCRLLSKKGLLALDPKAKIFKEKVLGMNKSFILYSGW